MARNTNFASSQRDVIFLISFKIMYLYVSMYVSVCVVPIDSRKGHQILCSCSYSHLYVSYGCWELNPDPLQEQPMPLTAETSSQLSGVGGIHRNAHKVWPFTVSSFHKYSCDTAGSDLQLNSI